MKTFKRTLLKITKILFFVLVGPSVILVILNGLNNFLWDNRIGSWLEYWTHLIFNITIVILFISFFLASDKDTYFNGYRITEETYLLD